MKKLLSGIFQSADSRFHLRTSLMIALIPIFPLLFLGYMIWVSVNTTFNFFRANGLKDTHIFHEVYIDYIMQDVLIYLPYIGLFFIILFFLGNYLAHLALRPFKKISEHAKLFGTDDTSWKMDTITNKKLISKYAEFFFKYLEAKKIQENFPIANIDKKYDEINAPVTDKIFYLHYFTIVSVISVVFITGLSLLTAEIHSDFVNFAMDLAIPKTSGLSVFLIEQSVLFDSVVYISSFFIVGLYLYISKSLISSVEGVSYHIFRVMRDIIKGNYKTRIELRKNDPGQECAVQVNKLLENELAK
jgi:hypothetical protein